MAIAQMNWGRMKFALDDERMTEFAAALDAVYSLAESHEGFIWRIPDDSATAQLQSLEHDELTSATVSVWETVETLKDYTFKTRHGEFLDKKSTWFEPVTGPQLVIWETAPTDQPTFQEAFDRLEHLKRHGPTDYAFGWPG